MKLKTHLFIPVLLLVFSNLYAQSWEKTFLSENTAAEGFDVHPTSDGGFIVVGEVDWPTGAIRHYIQLIKTDAEGNAEWSHTYHEGDIMFQEGRSVLQTSDGGYLVGGTHAYTNATDGFDLYLMKTNAMGDTMWTKTYNEPGIQNGRSVIATSDGGYLLAGQNNTGIVMVKTDVLGNQLWKHTYAGMEGANDVVQTMDGGYILTGGDQAETLILKTDVNGDSLWMNTYISSKYSTGNAIKQTSDGGYVVGSFASGFAGLNPMVLKTDVDGMEEWTSNFTLPELLFWGEVKDLDLTNDNGFVTTGFKKGTPQPFGPEGYIVRLDNLGNAQWGTLISETIDAYGNAVVTLDNDCYILTGGSSQGTFLAKICESDNPTSIKDIGLFKAIKVYPNPTKGNLSIVLSEEVRQQQLILRVFDVVGHQIMEQQLTRRESVVDLKDCPAGTYLYEVSQNGNIIQQDKLIIGH